MRSLYFDLDGTILDVSQRLFFLHSDIVKLLGGNPLPKEVYWKKKRDGISEELIGKECGVKEIARYIRLRKGRIELPRYLSYDGLIPGSRNVIQEMRKSNRTTLITARRSREHLYKQLQDLEIELLFDKILVAGEAQELWKVKAEIILSDTHFKRSCSAIVGDTEADVLAGKLLSMTTIAVLSGIRSKSKLILSQPDYIIKDITQLKNVLDNFPDEP